MFKTIFLSKKKTKTDLKRNKTADRRSAGAKKPTTGPVIDALDPVEADGAVAFVREDVEGRNRSRSSPRMWRQGRTRNNKSIAEIKSSFPVNFHRKMIKIRKSGTKTLANGTRPAKRRAHFSRTCGTEPRKNTKTHKYKSLNQVNAWTLTFIFALTK
jgi:hypothetical protein